MKFEGSSLVLPGGRKIHVVVLGAIATVIAAFLVYRGQQRQQSVSVGSSLPAATDQAIGALQSNLSSLQGTVQQLQSQLQAPQSQTTSSVPTPPVPLPAATPAPAAPIPPAPASTPTPAGQFVVVTPWPSQNSTLWGIGQSSGVGLGQIESLNPWIFQQRGTWDLVYSGDQIRVR